MTEFCDATKSSVTKEKYERRLGLFLRHIKVEGSTFSAGASSFARRAKVDDQWATLATNECMRSQKERQIVRWMLLAGSVIFICIPLSDFIHDALLAWGPGFE